MKVIKHGIPPTNVASCEECGCQFSYMRKDIHEESIYSNRATYFGHIYEDKKLYVECPDCGNHIPASTPTAKHYEQ